VSIVICPRFHNNHLFWLNTMNIV